MTNKKFDQIRTEICSDAKALFMVERSAPRALRRLSTAIGSNRLLVQGGGGNTSLKRGSVLWVKASGTWLAHASSENIFAALDLNGLRQSDMCENDNGVGPYVLGDALLRPSIETALHALLPQPVVVHVHSVNAIAWAVRSDGERLLASLMAGLNWAWVPYRRPGAPLAAAVHDVLDTASEIPDVLLLANHGLVVAGEDCTAVKTLLAEVERRIDLPERTPPAISRRLPPIDQDADWRAADDVRIDALARDEVTMALLRAGVLYPDHAVFLGPVAPILEGAGTLTRAVRRYHDEVGRNPFWMIVPGAGILLHTDITPGMIEMLHCMSMVGRRLTSSVKPVFLGVDDVSALLGWDAEHYRQSLERTSDRSVLTGC